MLLDDTLRELLRESTTIAIVGASDKESHPVNRVGRYLLQAGYTVLPVHPVRPTVWNLPVFRVLTDIEQAVDIVCLFRAAEHCPAHAREVLQMANKPRLFWMQQGIRSPEAARFVSAAGILPVEDMCLKVEHQRLLGPI